MNIGETIRNIRKQKSYTQIEVAERAGIAVNSLRLYESGSRHPTLDNLNKIAKALEVPISDLLSASFVPERSIKRVRIALDSDSEKSVLLNTNEQELEAFHEYLNNMGYEAKIDLKRFDLNVSEASNETVTANPDLKVWVINDHRKNKKYAVSTNDMNTLLKSVNDYTLFQIAKLLETAEEIE